MPIARSLPRAVRALLVCSLWPAVALAAPAAADPPPAPSFVGELLAIVVPLAFIIVGLLVVLRLARRRYGLTGSDTPLSIVQILPVGPRERVVLIRMRGGRVFAVGVGAQTVTFITDMEAGDLEGAKTVTSAEQADVSR